MVHSDNFCGDGAGMNERDQSNLDFLLCADAETLEDWYNAMPADDIEYAMEILSQASFELTVKELEIGINRKVTNTSEAKNILKQFTLKGNI